MVSKIINIHLHKASIFLRIWMRRGGRIFHSPSSLIFPACSPVLSDLLRDSLCTALQTEKLWIWSTGLSTLLTPSLGSGEPVCPDGTFAAGYTMDAWERWRIVCLAALSVEDIEDIYLFRTMITGILLIGLGFALCYRKIQKTGTAVQSLTRLSVRHDWSSGKSGQHWDWDY